MIKKTFFALTIALAVLSIQACDDNGGSNKVDLQCGDVVTNTLTRSDSTSERKIVAKDDVSNCSGTAITVNGPKSLDLNGHTVSCNGAAGTVGILLTGQGATVKNGIVENCEAGVLRRAAVITP